MYVFSYSFEIWNWLLLVSGNNNPAPKRNKHICFHILLRSGTGYCWSQAPLLCCTGGGLENRRTRLFACHAWFTQPLWDDGAQVHASYVWLARRTQRCVGIIIQVALGKTRRLAPQWRHDVIMGCLRLLQRCSQAVRANSHRPKSHNKTRQY